MSASQIPNLNTLRGPRLRGRGRGGGRGVPTGSSDQHSGDQVVQHTDQDATVSRLSAVELGYISDPFVKLFVAEGAQRRFPIINRGSYVRTSAIDVLVDRFLRTDLSRPKQLISLGAGSDTRYFRLATAYPQTPLLYHELDFSTNTKQKIATIKGSDLLRSLVAQAHDDDSAVQISEDGTALHSKSYHVHPIDLRTLRPQYEGSTPPPSLPGVDPHLPTLLLSECCLIYLPPVSADAVLKYFTEYIFPRTTPLSLILYEPINPSDSFGRVMVSNLAARGIVLQTLKRYSSLALQKERLRVMGFTSGQAAADVDFLWEKWIPEEEKERISQLEMLDELEEWTMLARHYCVAWGWRDGEEADTQSAFNGWKSLDVRRTEALV
ncbi:leucine carboxyl methyltransferase 1 [Xylona heveae TC161]|uniref:Leucine carboxyl methyltransferase 1 n=1 Tax=Xylona heveae (strain CBS 132557 / TC161) TaxID=1328760 RepID=A0A165INU0_XYLHT|nr:leucine carboxyl methyltransferase 1 [Xylona heveae TC161]KZF25168.1 leucine carboxyl methyltransferase 1 [Xylona heveae TC161]